MKQKAIIMGMALALTLCNTGANAMTDSKNLYRGMTMKEVRKEMGKPKHRSFNEFGEQWVYISTPLFGTYTDYTAVTFDNNGVLQRMRSYRIDDDAPKNINNPSLPMVGMAIDAPPYSTPAAMHRPIGWAMDESLFSVLLQKVSTSGFSDHKFDLIEVAALQGSFNCSQVSRLLIHFSFSDSKLKALKLLVPTIVDPQNAFAIYQLFRFDSDKEQAQQLMQQAGRR